MRALALVVLVGCGAPFSSTSIVDGSPDVDETSHTYASEPLEGSPQDAPGIAFEAADDAGYLRSLARDASLEASADGGLEASVDATVPVCASRGLSCPSSAPWALTCRGVPVCCNVEVCP